MPRIVIDSWKGVYNDEKEKGKGLLTNYACQSLLASVTFASLVYCVWGLQAAVAHSLMAFGAVFYLETISYLEHYGLRRRQLASGEYERVTIMHSWNAPHRFTNYLLFKLQRHSDHHENSSTPYQALASLEQSPFLPHGYNLMVLMAFFPKVILSPLRPGLGSSTLSSTPTKQSAKAPQKESAKQPSTSQLEKHGSSLLKSPSAP